jgi:hypothetical protein
MQYAAKVSGTPSRLYTYGYMTESQGGNTGNRLLTTNSTQTAASTCYVLYTTLNTDVGDAVSAYFYINNGGNGSGDTPPSSCKP